MAIAPGNTPVATQDLPELFLMLMGQTMTSFPLAVYEMSPGVAGIADSSTIATLNAAYGIALGVTATGTVQVARSGYIKNAGWSWTSYQLIYVGVAGALTQVAPSSNPTVLGYAISATEMEVRISATGQSYSADGTTITLTGTQFGLTPIASGAILANTTGGTAKPAALPPGSTGQVLTISGGVPTWAAGGGGGGGGGGLQILASASAQGASDTNYSTSSSSFVPVDAANLSLMFTVPASGSVLITLNALCTATGSGVHYWGLLNSSGALVGSYSQCVSSPSSATDNASSGVAQFLVEGLTPGASVTYQWGYKIQAGSSPSALIYHGPNLGLAQMVIYAVNTATPPSVSKSVVVPITGFSNTIPSSSTASIIAYVINPAGTLATGTLTMPATPLDGQIVTLSSTWAITAITLNANAGQSIKNAVTTLNPGPAGTVRYIYDLASTTWYPA